MKTQRTKILEAQVSQLQLIRAGKSITGTEDTFNVTVKKVTRSLQDIPEEQWPALFVTSAAETNKHYLSDVRQVTEKTFISGMVVVNKDSKVTAADLSDQLSDDVVAIFTRDTTWGGLARRTRILSVSPTPEYEEPKGAFIIESEVDYIEMSSAPTPTTAPPAKVINPSDPQRKQILDTFFNALLSISGIVWVEDSDIWPVPPEQVPQSHTPGIWFNDQQEQYEYRGSQTTKKTITMNLVVLVVEPNLAKFSVTQEMWVAALKVLLGKKADLGDMVYTVDILEIRTTRSEYPLVNIECDLTLNYLQSFMAA